MNGTLSNRWFPVAADIILHSTLLFASASDLISIMAESRKHMNYIGSKKSLTNFIFTTMETFISGKHQTNGTVTDLFSGTGTVAKEFKRRGYNVNGNDLQYYSYASLKHYLENNSELQFEQFDTNPFTILNKLEGVEGFIYKESLRKRLGLQPR